MGDKPSEVSLPVFDVRKNGATECYCDGITRSIGPYFNAQMEFRDFFVKFLV
jgi:hypothetical protein